MIPVSQNSVAQVVITQLRCSGCLFGYGSPGHLCDCQLLLYQGQCNNGIGEGEPALHWPRKITMYVSDVDPYSLHYLFSWSGLVLKYVIRNSHCYLCRSGLDVSSIHSTWSLNAFVQLISHQEFP